MPLAFVIHALVPFIPNQTSSAVLWLVAGLKESQLSSFSFMYKHNKGHYTQLALFNLLFRSA